MRNLSTSLMLFLAFLLVGCVSRGPRPSTEGEIFLYSVATEPDGEPVAWVLGSVHLARQGDGLDRAALEAYDRAKTLAVELDVDRVDPVTLSRVVTSSGSYPEGGSLSAALGPKDFERLGRLLVKAGLPAEAADTWKPWLAAMVLGFTSMQQGGGGDTQASEGEGAKPGGAVVGVDRFFLERARDERPIISLETIEEQIDALTSASEEVQLAELRHTIDALERGESPLDEVLDSYMAGDASALEAQIAAGGIEGERKAWLDRILRDRNIHMAERAAALIRSGERPFIVVGAGHLVGPSAVQTLLGGMGFHVTPVRRSGEKVPLVLGASGNASRKAPAARGPVTGYRIGWPCADTASGLFAPRNAEPSSASCQSGDVNFVIASVYLPAGAGSMVTDEQFFGIQLEQLKQVAKGPMDHALVKVGAVDAEGRPQAFEFAASRFAFATDEAHILGLMVKDGDRILSVMAVAPLGAKGLDAAADTLSTLVLTLAAE